MGGCCTGKDPEKEVSKIDIVNEDDPFSERAGKPTINTEEITFQEKFANIDINNIMVKVDFALILGYTR